MNQPMTKNVTSIKAELTKTKELQARLDRLESILAGFYLHTDAKAILRAPKAYRDAYSSGKEIVKGVKA